MCLRNANSFAYRLALRSIEGKRSELRGELAEAFAHREKEVLNLTLSGAAFPGHTAQFDALAHVMSRGQRLFTSILQAISVGPTSRGPVPLSVRHLAQLRLAQVEASSFKMVIELDTAPDLVGGSTSVTALETLFALLRAEPTSEALLTRVGALGPRAVGHYKHWLDGLVQTGTSVALGWNDPFGRDHLWDPGPNTLAETYRALTSIRTDRTEEVIATGALLGASLLRNRFEFLKDDGELVTGRIAKEAKDSVAAHFGQSCTITYTVITTRDDLAGTTSRTATLTRVT